MILGSKLLMFWTSIKGFRGERMGTGPTLRPLVATVGSAAPQSDTGLLSRGGRGAGVEGELVLS